MLEQIPTWLTALFLALSLTLAVSAGYLIIRNRRLYREIDRMLDAVLTRQPIKHSDLEEGKLSALAGKAKRIQEHLLLEIEQANQEKEQVKQLIANMSHQLKTPLANVMMYEELLGSQKPSPGQQARFLEKMHTQTVKIDWILQSLFKMAKLEQDAIDFEITPLPVHDTLMDALNTIYAKAEQKQIQIELETGKNPILMHNRKWTAEVFANLLENAVKYTDTGGKIRIAIQSLEMYTQISFSDTGIGIDPSEYQAIFRRFYRCRQAENIEGSGIGLYLSKMILEKEFGYLTVESQPGKGSRFTVFLQNRKN